MSYNITFINCSDDERDKLIKKGKDYLGNIIDDLNYYMNADDPESDDDEEHPPFSEEYDLRIDFVEDGTFEDQDEPYYQYLLSWGGPSAEIRFYRSGLIEFVYMDWFVGIGFDVRNEPCMQWLEDRLKGLGLIKWY